MIFVERENTHEKTHPCNLIYYVTENNELYYANAEKEDEKALLPGTLCEIYEQSTKEKKHRKIDNRIVLIGQPIEINNENNENIWTMPAVIKRPNLLGKLFRPDLYIIEYKQIDNITLKPEPTLKRKQLKYEKPEAELVPNFVITKIGEGHRTKVTKIGLLNDKSDALISGEQNTKIFPYLVSSSEWPTIKIYAIIYQKAFHDLKNNAIIDIIQSKDSTSIVVSETQQVWLSKNKFLFSSILLTENDRFLRGDKTDIQIELPNLPNISFDPNIVTNFDCDDAANILENYLTLSQEKTDFQHSIYYASANYVLIVSPYDKNIHIQNLAAKNKKEVLKTTVKELKDFFSGNNDINFKNTIVTATAFDFKRYHLFCATYNKNTKQSKIHKIHLRNTLGFKEKETHDDSSSDEG
jgi:hypothetical protein